MDHTRFLYRDTVREKNEREREREREKLENRMFRVFVDGHAGIGNKLSYEQAKWWWRNAGGKPLVVDGRVLNVWPTGSDSEIAAPTPLDDLKVHGHVSRNPKNGRIYDGEYDFEPEVMQPSQDSNLIDKTRLGIRNYLNKLAIEEHGQGTPFEIKYRYQDEDFE